MAFFILQPGNRWTAYQHDNLGNVIRADYYDDTWETFTYDKNGLLKETANDHVTVKLERDASGQVIKEWQNDHWIESSYDELGNRSQITSSLGANITVARNGMGNVMQMTATHSDQNQWTASMQYNELGQEIERILPGDVISKWQYDITGRPTHHRVKSQNRDTRRRVYNWDVNHRLRSMVNELTGVKVTYGYDEFSNLVWANQDSQFDFLYRSVDDVGNLYETREKSDRVYGPGSRLLETKDAKFSYDEEGNLVKKVENNGDTWKYEYYGNGMMAKVIKPDKTEVTFKYDTLGRRVEKSSDEKTMRFVWDGNTILHEYDSQKDSAEPDLVTWVFNDGFVPTAKITSEGHYSIISDYLGTPVEAYDDEGNKVWSADLDVYGRVKEFTGEKDFIPFRYQGQYDDVEIGLYYNRFRYYDPEQGNYTQIDPIGLAGNNPTLYGYVSDPNIELDTFGLAKTYTYILQNLWKSYTGKDATGDIHHGFPEQYKDKFMKLAGIDVNDPKYFYDLSKKQHTKKPGIHTNSSKTGKNWNKVWKNILNETPTKFPNASQQELKQYFENTLDRMAKKSNINSRSATSIKNVPCRKK
ncbi:RHS repeat-associated core domain-containing protein [Lysinibacillus telephonicus]|uniref:RHS repeat domain-containing protein n=1 Tax=Lysinibacillus telephonicus TaxID=1714840 RepID=UPI0039783D7A